MSGTTDCLRSSMVFPDSGLQIQNTWRQYVERMLLEIPADHVTDQKRLSAKMCQVSSCAIGSECLRNLSTYDEWEWKTSAWGPQMVHSIIVPLLSVVIHVSKVMLETDITLLAGVITMRKRLGRLIIAFQLQGKHFGSPGGKRCCPVFNCVYSSKLQLSIHQYYPRYLKIDLYVTWGYMG